MSQACDACVNGHASSLLRYVFDGVFLSSSGDEKKG